MSLNLENDSEIRRVARKRVGMKMGFYTHAMVFILVNAGILLLASATGEMRWHRFPLWGWGLGLAIHGVVTFLALQTHGLRERMMEREMEKLRRG